MISNNLSPRMAIVHYARLEISFATRSAVALLAPDRAGCPPQRRYVRRAYALAGQIHAAPAGPAAAASGSTGSTNAAMERARFTAG